MYFPGTIISIFSNLDTFFVESESNNTVYLAIIYDEDLVLNVTLPGNVVFYGS